MDFLDELIQLISDAYYYIPDSMNCAGYKCRLPQCSACYNQDEGSGVGDLLARIQAVMEADEQLRERLRELEADKARLDWLDLNPTSRIIAEPSVREAIDAAREGK